MKQPRKPTPSAKRRPPKKAARPRWYQLKISLRGTTPEIWRRIVVRGDSRLDLLHAVIQLAMGWTNSHLHMFLVGADCYSAPTMDEGPRFEGEEKEKDERQLSLSTIADAGIGAFGYQYDFGDSWDHVIRIEKEVPHLEGRVIAWCLEGARACPPEDCGGVCGFAELLKAMKRARGSEYQSFVEWLGGPFDPGRFDVRGTNILLAMLRWPRISVGQLARILALAEPGLRN